MWCAKRPRCCSDGAELLARSTTYAAASFGLQVGGGSAGINAKPDDRDAALAAFLEEVAPLIESGRWLPGPGVGVSADDLVGLLPPPTIAPRPSTRSRPARARSPPPSAPLGSLNGKQVGIVGAGPIADAAAASVAANGGTPSRQGSFDAASDVLLVAGKAGVLEHDLAATVKARVVVPLTPVPVTARALAVLGRAGVVVVPDFLSTAAPLLMALDAAGGEATTRIHDAVAALADEGTNLWMAAVTKAEDHLRTWQDALPFGRPLS